MRSVWQGAISFGLVNIPVAVYSATREEKLTFKTFRRSDMSPIRLKKVAEADDKEVKADDIVKGYEFEKKKWVTLEDSDFEAVQIESTRTIEITDFVDAKDIDAKYFYKPYFLEAAKGGDKSYALLHRALAETGKIGIAQVALRNREYLCAIKPDGLFLMLEMMHFAHEIIDPSELRAAAASTFTPKEIQMAKQLVESLSGEFEPTKYRDRYQEACRRSSTKRFTSFPSVKPLQLRGPMEKSSTCLPFCKRASAVRRTNAKRPRPRTPTHAIARPGQWSRKSAHPWARGISAIRMHFVERLREAGQPPSSATLK